MASIAVARLILDERILGHAFVPWHVRVHAQPGKVKRLNNLVDMMRMVTGKSSLALATLAIFHKGPSFDNHQVGTNIYCMLVDCK
jgi:hypothetical protein